jgi:hypothetical protein
MPRKDPVHYVIVGLIGVVLLALVGCAAPQSEPHNANSSANKSPTEETSPTPYASPKPTASPAPHLEASLVAVGGDYDSYSLKFRVNVGDEMDSRIPATQLGTSTLNAGYAGLVEVQNTTSGRDFPIGGGQINGDQTLSIWGSFDTPSAACTLKWAKKKLSGCIVELSSTYITGEASIPAGATVTSTLTPDISNVLPDGQVDPMVAALKTPLAIGVVWVRRGAMAGRGTDFPNQCTVPGIYNGNFDGPGVIPKLVGTIPDGNASKFC